MQTKVDSVGSLHLFHKFMWELRVRHVDGKIEHCVTRRPDSVFKAADLDSVTMTTTFYVDGRLRNTIIPVHYALEGSLLLALNGHPELKTGVFATEDEQHKYIQDDYMDVVFTDSIATISIEYIPYPKARTFELGLKMYQKKLGDQKKLYDIADAKEAAAKGFYYLALSIVFFFLFVFFRERTENLYFALFCFFAALSFCWKLAETDVLYNLELFFGIFCFEFLSIFFCKILKNREKSKVPLIIIAVAMLVCSLPFVRYNYFAISGTYVPWVIAVVSGILYSYAWISTIYFLVQGIGQKRWEARTILVICFIPIVVFVVLGIIFVVYLVSHPGKEDYNNVFNILFNYLATTIVFTYPLAAVFILGKRNGLNQKQLIEQVNSIQRLSEENLAKEQEKKHILENQKESLEREVVARTREVVAQKEEIEKQHDELKVEKKKSDDLLRNILPDEVAEELKEKGSTKAKLFDNVTVLFADFVDFTKAGEAMAPQELVNELHECFKGFDEIISHYGIEKIKTIGDAYLAVCGLPQADDRHAEKVVLAATEINEFMRRRQVQTGGKTFRVRLGVHSGSVVAGIVGVKKFAYDIWGDTVNTAARMEQNSEPGKINISQSTYDLVNDKFNCEYRGEIDAKNKGMLKMYYVSMP